MASSSYGYPPYKAIPVSDLPVQTTFSGMQLIGYSQQLKGTALLSDSLLTEMAANIAAAEEAATSAGTSAGNASASASSASSSASSASASATAAEQAAAIAEGAKPDISVIAGVDPLLDFDLTSPRGATFSKFLTRATPGGYVCNAKGVLVPTVAGEPMVSFDPVSGAPLGTGFWQAYTNYITNNTMAGGVAGTPGTLPTGWIASLNGLTQEIVAVGTEDGIKYIDIRLSGTATEIWASITIPGGTGIYSGGGTAMVSAYITMQAGSLANIGDIDLANRALLSPSGNEDQYISLNSGLSSGAPLKSARYQIANTPAGTLTGDGQVFILFNNMTGAIDITLRIGFPAFTKTAVAPPVLATSSATVARDADVFTIAGDDFADIYSPDAISIFADFIVPTVPSGSFGFIFEINDTTFNNRIYALINDANQVDVGVASAGTTQTILLGTVTVGEQVRIAAGVKDGVFRGSFNGLAAISGATNMPVSPTQMLVGQGKDGPPLGMLISRMALFPTALSAATLKDLTA